MQLLISDANILIDMEEGGLVTLFFNLPYEFCVPNVLYFEELEEQHAHLSELGLGLKELSSASLSQVPAIKARYVGPSTNDVFALLLAQQEGCPCFPVTKTFATLQPLSGLRCAAQFGWLKSWCSRVSSITMRLSKHTTK